MPDQWSMAAVVRFFGFYLSSVLALGRILFIRPSNNEFVYLGLHRQTGRSSAGHGHRQAL